MKKSGIPLVTDDPQEINSQPLAWYAENTFNACGVVAHLLDERRDSKYFQNAKYSFVSGIAYGFNKQILMLAHAPYKPPLDYMHLLQVHETAANCISAVDAWLPTIKQYYSIQRDKYIEHVREGDQAVDLQRISLGQDIAENEQQSLLNYFVDTAAYQEALRPPPSMIYVGRKGSGKTANLYKIADELQRQDPHNHICVIKPISYELEGVLDLLRSSIPRSEQGFLIESLWKFLLYTELALSVYEELQSKPIHYTRTPEENEFIEYYLDTLPEPCSSEFTVRMEHAIKDLCQIDTFKTVTAQRAKVSEILHRDLLENCARFLGKCWKRKFEYVYLLTI